jgi:tungstate transport system permease protein
MFAGELADTVWRTLFVSGLALLLGGGVGVPLGAWLALASFRGKRLVVVLLHTAMGLPPVVVGLLVYLLLSHSGPLGGLDWLFTPWAMVLAQSAIALPLIAGLTHAAVAAVPRGLVPQLLSLGVGPRQVRRLLLREARAGVITAVAAGFGRIVAEVGAALMVGGNIQGHTRVLSTAIVLETGKGQFALALALSGWLFALTLAVNTLILRLHETPP